MELPRPPTRLPVSASGGSGPPPRSWAPWYVVKYRVVDPDLLHFGNLDPHPSLHSRQIKIRIRIKMFKLNPEQDPDPHQFVIVKPKCMEFEPILALLQGFDPFLKLGSGSGSGSSFA